MNKNHAIGLVLLILISGLTGCKSQFLQTSPQSISVTGKQIIPLSFHRNVPIVSVKINGQGPYRLVLDSAAALSCLSPQTIEELSLPESPYDGYQYFKIHGKDVSSDYRRIDHLRLGNVTLRNLDVGCFNVRTDFFGEDQQIDGVLSLRVFLHALSTIDYPNKQLIIAPYKSLNSDHPNVVHAKLNISLIQRINLYVVDRRLPCVIDTSSSYGLLFFSLTGMGLPFIANDPIDSQPYHTPYYNSIKDESVRVVPSQLNAAFYLGGHHVLQPTIQNLILSNISTATEEEINYLVRVRVSVIGGDLLKHFAVTFDLRKNRIQFTRPDQTPLQINPAPDMKTEPDSETTPDPTDEVDDSVVFMGPTQLAG